MPAAPKPRRWSAGRILAAIVIAALLGAGGWRAWVALRGPEVPAVRVEPGTLRQTLVVAGRVIAPARVDVGSVVTGRVAEVLVEEGQAVDAGAPLVRLDTAELAASVAQARAGEATAQARLQGWREAGLPSAEAAVRQAEAVLAQSERENARTQELFDKGFVGQARLDETRRALAVAREQLATARAQALTNRPDGAEAQQARTRLQEARAARELAQARLAQAEIRAPGPSVVLLRSVEPGDVVQPGRRLLSLAVGRETRLVAQIDERNLPLLAPGRRATASADAFPATKFDAEVLTISPQVDAQRGTVEVKFLVREPPALLRTDMTVSIEIDAGVLEGALVVPAAALRDVAAPDPHVLVAEGGRAVRRPVRVGVASAGLVEIREGLARGDLVLVDPAAMEGARVRAVPGRLDAAAATKAAGPAGYLPTMAR